MTKWLHSITLSLLAVALLWQAGRMHEGLLTQREAMNPGEVSALETMPPMVAFTSVALGGFRGIIADILWLRSTKMQEEGRYFELVQLANWITTLEPRFSPVWAFHAWNLAYNVSVLFNDPPDRWRWVRHGIELLRDKALVYNPGDALLYNELSWLFQHKVGEELDQAHFYYKSEWAREMGRLFEGRSPNYEELAAAPQNEEELLERPAAAELVDLLTEKGYDATEPALLLRAEGDEELAALLREHPGGPDLSQYLRLQLLTEVYRLDPRDMQAIEQKYGPVDWRMPQAHALYWAYQGLPHAEGFNSVKLRRAIFQSQAIAFRKGTAFIDVDGNVIPSPTPELVPFVRLAFEEAIAAEPKMAKSYGEAYRNFLREAISLLYAYRRIDDAKALFEVLRENDPKGETDVGFQQYVVNTLAGRMDKLSSRSAMMLIEGFLGQSFRWQAMGDDERAAGYFELAALYYREYMMKLRPGEHEERLALPSFQEVIRLTLERVPDEALGPNARARLQEIREEKAGSTEPEAEAVEE